MWRFLVESATWVLSGFWPAILAVLTIAALSIRLPAHTRLVFLGVSLLSLSLSLGIALRDADDPFRNILMRDVAAVAVLSLLAPVAAYLAVLLLRGNRGWVRAAAAIAAGMAPIVSSPIVLLLVHCSSGDCL